MYNFHVYLLECVFFYILLVSSYKLELYQDLFPLCALKYAYQPISHIWHIFVVKFDVLTLA